ncbi:GerAB/ArcD/ProY family transporter [Natranaerofaba carboxydovora]|uniref:GerAB/ArcD/ProY family transporter n=1 Tax=Natranaerofaba carboxydovora TaxID=2742683 RepID=UPI001F13A5A8|nr:endospore germination permease [Natranaerofaba carboxydovora]UMZ72621.1 Spore germination protein YndE [Natranaerofaba carboxydovora]
MAVEKIHNRQLLIMTFILRTTVAFAFLPVLTTGTARQDAWASSILMYIGTVVLLLIIVGLAVKFPDKTIVQYSEILLGSVLGKVISFLVLWMFLHMAATEARIYGELINIAFLTRTPVFLIQAGMIILAAITVYLGIEVIGRMADFVLPWFIILIFVTIIFSLVDVTPENFEPILARGMAPVIKSSLTPIAIAIQILTVAMILPRTNEPNKGIKTVFVSITFASFMVLVVSVVVVLVIGPELGNNAVFPFLFTIRNVETGEVLERIEIFTVLAWGLGIYITLSVYLYCGAKGISQWLNLESYRPLVFPMAAIWTALSIHSFDTVYQLESFLAPEIIFPYAMTAIGIIYGFLWGGYLFKKLFVKRKGGNLEN